MTTTWLLIANAEKALIYDITKASGTEEQKISLIHTLLHPRGKMKNLDLVTDRSGHYRSGDGKSVHRGAFVAHESPHEVELEHFAVEIAQFLKHEYDERRYVQLVIAVAPHFFGVLEKHLPESIKQSIKHYLHKDYAALPEGKLEETVSKIKNEYFHRSP